MQILPRFQGAARAHRLAASQLATSSPARPYPGQPPLSRAEHLSQRVQETIADGIVYLSRSETLAKLGYKLYGAATRPREDVSEIENRSALTPMLWRGAQPTRSGFAALRDEGVRTILNLRPEANWEAPMVQALGMRYLYMPLPAVGAPSREQALAFLSAVTDPANGRVFFHCQHGADRTGAMAAAYRIAAQGWTVERALAEMYGHGFHAGYQDDKADFVLDFAKYWAGLDEPTRRAVLHQGPQAVPPRS